ncbi:hypothetical protein CPB83DRAFT_830814 [Crepidotus variabilis]|uniref:Uncharacterized protein n=1 Tax=Crepidotus variabilis TaxID=179855 RepID=A0A9P6JUS3_9AGAR|nr:hypothetical protein CPB83DRAFT_830814 [Crepidotus variabilis]
MRFHMVAMSLNRMHNAPLDNIWVQFGFCTSNEELELAGLYYALLRDVGFEEFFDTFKSSRASNTFAPSVIRDYGLINCKTGEEEMTPKDAYLSFFKKPDADPPALHQGCLRRDVSKYLSGIVKLKNKKMLERLMKNQHTRKV